MLCQVHRCCTNQAPPYLCSKFTPNSDLNCIRTRVSNKLHLPRHWTNFYHSSFESEEPCILTIYWRTSESLRDVNNLRLPYLSITIIFHRFIFLLLLLFFVFCCCCCFLFSLVALSLCVSNQVLSSSLLFLVSLTK